MKFGYKGVLCDECEAGYVKDKDGKCIEKQKKDCFKDGTETILADDCICKVNFLVVQVL